MADGHFATKETPEELGWTHKSDVAQKFYPNYPKRSATTLLRQHICDWHPIEYFLLYNRLSPMYTAHHYFSKEQTELVDKLMTRDFSDAEEIRMVQTYGDIRVLKIAFAHDGLFPHLLPHVALQRMVLLLKRNYHIFDKVFPTEEDAASELMTLKQAYMIARAFKSKEGIKWILEVKSEE